MGKRTKNPHPGLYKRGRYWWITRDPVLDKPQSTRCTTLKAALEYQAERERLGANPAYAASQAAQLGEWCDRFVKMKRSTGSSVSTISYMKGKLGHWIRIYGREAALSTFAEPAVWDSYLEQRTEEGAANHTVSKECKVLRQVLASAKRAKCFVGDVRELRPEGLTTSYTPRNRALTAEEIRALLPELSLTIGTLVAVTISLGLRLSEALKLEPKDVDFATGLVHVRGTKTKGSDRVIPILSPFRVLLQQALPHLPLVEKPHNLYRDLNAACGRAGIAKAGPNDFRRTHASILAELGAGEEQTAKLLGHTSTEMVRRVYAKPRAAAIGALVERSIGVVELALGGPGSSSQTAAKSSESQERANQCQPSDRPPEPKVKGSNPFGRAENKGVVSRAHAHAPRLSRGCSGLELPQLALAYAAVLTGVLPENPATPWRRSA